VHYGRQFLSGFQCDRRGYGRTRLCGPVSGLSHKDEEVPAGESSGEPAPDSAAQEGNALVIQMPTACFTPEALNNPHSLTGLSAFKFCGRQA